MIHYSKEELDHLFKDDQFKKDYENYCKNNNELNEFLKFIDSIENNKKYFRLEPKKGKRKNININNDTNIIKEINSYLNKITDKNKEGLCNEIIKKIEKKEHLNKLILETILSKCIIQSNYCLIYLESIEIIFKNLKNRNTMIENIINSLYNNIEKDIDKTQSEYLQFCDKNKQLDKYVGYSNLVSECEKKNILNGKIDPILENLMIKIDETELDEEKYRGVQCLYTILNTFYKNKRLPKMYLLRINSLIKKEKSMKIKFKLMDIIDRK